MITEVLPKRFVVVFKLFAIGSNPLFSPNNNTPFGSFKTKLGRLDLIYFFGLIGLSDYTSRYTSTLLGYTRADGFIVSFAFSRFMDFEEIALKDLDRTSIYGRCPYVAYDDSFKVVVYLVDIVEFINYR